MPGLNNVSGQTGEIKDNYRYLRRWFLSLCMQIERRIISPSQSGIHSYARSSNARVIARARDVINSLARVRIYRRREIVLSLQDKREVAGEGREGAR